MKIRTRSKKVAEPIQAWNSRRVNEAAIAGSRGHLGAWRTRVSGVVWLAVSCVAGLQATASGNPSGAVNPGVPWPAADALGLPAEDAVALDFKWWDNAQKPGDIMDSYLSGDVAPEGRFRFRYVGGGTLQPRAARGNAEDLQP